MNSHEDPREALARNPMNLVQTVVVAITIGLNALDGFDVLSISFASPGIAREWGIRSGALGIVLSMELLGMAIGSITLGALADRRGRRGTLVGSLIVMTLGMGLASRAGSVLQLSLLRVLTGIGVGGVLATTNALAAEFSSGPARFRRFADGDRVPGRRRHRRGDRRGTPARAQLALRVRLRRHRHRGVRAARALADSRIDDLAVPATAGGRPATRQRESRRLGYAAVAALPTPGARTAPRHSLVELFDDGMARRMILVTLTYFLHITTFYFILKWVPKIVVDIGFTAASAAGVLVWANLGGATGGAVLGLLTQRWQLKYLTAGPRVLDAARVGLRPRSDDDRGSLGDLRRHGLLHQWRGRRHLRRAGADVPVESARGGTGFAIGFGRGRSVLAPIIAGFLFQAGFGLQFVAIAMGAGSLVAAICLLNLRLEPATIA